MDGRRIPRSQQTVRAEGAAERAVNSLRAERKALAEARSVADGAREKAKASGGKGDKTAAKKARLKVDRIVDRVAKARTEVRQTTVRVAELKAEDRLKARHAHIEYRLKAAEAAAKERIETKLGRAVEKFETAERAKLERVERRKAKAFQAQMAAHRDKFQREHDETVEEAQLALEPKPRKKRRRRRRATA